MDTFKNYALAVVLACVAVVGLVVLNVTHTDTTGFEKTLGLVVLPLIGLVISKVNGVERNTNGNTSRLLDELAALRRLVARQAELLAQSTPVATPVPGPDDTQPPPPQAAHPERGTLPGSVFSPPLV